MKIKLSSCSYKKINKTFKFSLPRNSHISYVFSHRSFIDELMIQLELTKERDN